MTEPYRDPDGPIHAVLAAANAVAPRCLCEPGVALIHARYKYPPPLPDEVGEVEGRLTAQLAADPTEGPRRRLREALDAAKRRTRRDVAGVIT